MSGVYILHREFSNKFFVFKDMKNYKQYLKATQADIEIMEGKKLTLKEVRERMEEEYLFEFVDFY